MKIMKKNFWITGLLSFVCAFGLCSCSGVKYYKQGKESDYKAGYEISFLQAEGAYTPTTDFFDVLPELESPPLFVPGDALTVYYNDAARSSIVGYEVKQALFLEVNLYVAPGGVDYWDAVPDQDDQDDFENAQINYIVTKDRNVIDVKKYKGSERVYASYAKDKKNARGEIRLLSVWEEPPR